MSGAVMNSGVSSQTWQEKQQYILKWQLFFGDMTSHKYFL